MLAPSYSLTSTERVLPRLALDFTTALLDPRVTFTRTTGASNPATYINSSGVITAATNNQPRFDYDPVTLVCKGLLIEESRTNALLNSDTLSTQSVTVTAAASTLSFYGTGEVVLSGAHSATVTGTGAYPTRTTLTFTPSAGTLTLTVTGTVQFAQLEIGAFATSYIPTTTTPLTRNADVAVMTGTNFSDWYNQSEGTFVTDVIPLSIAGTAARNIFNVNDGTTNNFIRSYYDGSNRWVACRNAGVTTFAPPFSSATAGQKFGLALAYKVGSYAAAVDGGTPSTGSNASAIVSPIQMNIGSTSAAASLLNGHIAALNYYPQRLTNAETQATSK